MTVSPRAGGCGVQNLGGKAKLRQALAECLCGGCSPDRCFVAAADVTMAETAAWRHALITQRLMQIL
jgi:hypothetical protein